MAQEDENTVSKHNTAESKSDGPEGSVSEAISELKRSVDSETKAVSSAVAAFVAVTDKVVEQNSRDIKWRRNKFLFTACLVIGLLIMNVGSEVVQEYTVLNNDYVSLVKIEGEIGPGRQASPEAINPLLVKAFKDNKAKGIILAINSPGGTPVAASEIRNRIITLREEYPDKKVITMAGDYLTSGAYMIATGADMIYANESSMVGSIGVIIRTFGFDKVASKYGVERRVITAGENKAGMDSFMPLSDKDRSKVESKLANIHDNFITMVKESRGERLNLNYKDVFSGEYWTGDVSKDVGLIDGVGYLAEISQKEFGTSNFKVHSAQKELWRSITEPANAMISSLLGLEDSPVLMAY